MRFIDRVTGIEMPESREVIWSISCFPCCVYGFSDDKDLFVMHVCPAVLQERAKFV